MSAGTWEIDKADAGSFALDKALAGGWEPFAVTRDTRNDYSESITRPSQHEVDVVWLRRFVPKEETPRGGR